MTTVMEQKATNKYDLPSDPMPFRYLEGNSFADVIEFRSREAFATEQRLSELLRSNKQTIPGRHLPKRGEIRSSIALSRRSEIPELRELLVRGSVGEALLRLFYPNIRHTLDAITVARKRVSLECRDASEQFPTVAWNRMRALLISIAVDFSKDHHRSVVPVPIITLGEEGEADAQWRGPTRNLLVSVDGETSEPVYFHGQDWQRPSHTIKGRLDETMQNGWLLAWLKA